MQWRSRVNVIAGLFALGFLYLWLAYIIPLESKVGEPEAPQAWKLLALHTETTTSTKDRIPAEPVQCSLLNLSSPLMVHQNDKSLDNITTTTTTTDKKNAYVTLVCDNNFFMGAIAWAESLKETGTQNDIVILVTENVDEALQKTLTGVGRVVVVPYIENPNESNNKALPKQKLGYEESKWEEWKQRYPGKRQECLFNKMHLFSMVEYQKLVFMDSDTIALSNLDELFERPPWSAVPDMVPPDTFNSGLLVIEPSVALYRYLTRMMKEIPSWNGGDQGFFNTLIPDWFQCPPIYRLSYVFNSMSKVKLWYRASWLLIQKQGIKVLHFSPSKPWKDPKFEDPNFGSLHQVWWKFFDRGIAALSEDLKVLCYTFLSSVQNTPFFKTKEGTKVIDKNTNTKHKTQT